MTIYPADLDRALSLRRPLEGELLLGSAAVKLDPSSCTLVVASHSGHRIRPLFRARTGMTETERRRAEDSVIGKIAQSTATHLVALDSPFEYDLDRPRDEIYSVAPPRLELARSLARHEEFYRTLDLVVRRLLRVHGSLLVHDLHFYDAPAGREDQSPLFNLGTALVDRKRFGDVLDHWRDQLAAIRFRGDPGPRDRDRVAENVVFDGSDEVATFLSERYQRVLVIPTGVRRVYVDDKGKSNAALAKRLRQGLLEAMARTTEHFADSLDHRATVTVGVPRRKNVLRAVRAIDAELCAIAGSIDPDRATLPTNAVEERKRFLDNPEASDPTWTYPPHALDLEGARQRLHDLPIHELERNPLQELLADKRRELALELTLLENRENRDYFQATSREVHGAPDAALEERARSILEATDGVLAERDETLTAADARKHLEAMATWLGTGTERFALELCTGKHPFGAASSWGTTLALPAGRRLKLGELRAIAAREICAHLLTARNGALQPLELLGVGLAGGHRTAHGLGVLMEYLHGALTPLRLRELAARVVVTAALGEGQSFRESFALLRGEHRFKARDAYDVCQRVHRGGGFLAEALPLAGFLELLEYREAGGDLSILLAGRFPLEYATRAAAAVEEGLLRPPCFLPPVLRPGGGENPLGLAGQVAAALPCQELIEGVAV